MRGDREVNEIKLARAAGAGELRAATADDLADNGIVPGHASPLGIRGATVIADDLAARSPNLVAGANQAGYHLRHTNVGRDYTPDLVADLVAVNAGMACPGCGEALGMARGVEVGQIFKLGGATARRSARRSWTRVGNCARSRWAATASASGG